MNKSDQPDNGASGSDDEYLFTRIGDTAQSHETMLQQAAGLARLGYFVFNIEKEIVEVCSARHASIFGRTPDEFMSMVTGLKGKMSMMHPDDAKDVRTAYGRLRNGDPIELEYRFFRKDGSLGYIREFVAAERNAEGRVVRGLGSSMDVTELRILEQKRAHASRLEALGELTAGVAHDFNNLLAVILGNAEIAETVSSPLERERCLREIIDAAQRGGSLTRNLLSFAQQATISPGPTDICGEVLRAVETFRRTSLKQLSVSTTIHPEPLVANVDTDLLQSVLMNLLINARDAVEMGGAIEVSTFPTALNDVRGLLSEYPLADDRYCTVRISDNGCGIPARLMSRVTEPFFTTKSRAEGSGLGLAMATGFAQQAKGALEVQSEEGAGTAVMLHFPVIDPPAELAGQEKAANHDLNEKKLLLLEDDPAVAKMLSKRFALAGMNVMSVDTAAQAISAVHRQDIHVAVLDNIIPGDMSGIDVAAHIKTANPAVKTVLLSGYLCNDLTEQSYPLDRTMQKPTPFPALLEAIEQLLECTD